MSCFVSMLFLVTFNGRMFVENLILLMKRPPCILRKQPFRKLRCFEKVGKSVKNDKVILVALLRMTFLDIYFSLHRYFILWLFFVNIINYF